MAKNSDTPAKRSAIKFAQDETKDGGRQSAVGRYGYRPATFERQAPINSRWNGLARLGLEVSDHPTYRRSPGYFESWLCNRQEEGLTFALSSPKL